VQQEPDASSFPAEVSGAHSKPVGIPRGILLRLCSYMEKHFPFQPIFVSYTGETLDTKAPLLKALKAVDLAATQVCQLFDKDIQHVVASLGAEQEYFVVDKALFQARPDLVMAGKQSSAMLLRADSNWKITTSDPSPAVCMIS
jgi:glutamine synthetase